MSKRVKGSEGRGGGRSTKLTGALWRRLYPGLVIVALAFAAVQFVLEMVAWGNRVAAFRGQSPAQTREDILGDLAPFLEDAARRIPEDARVLLVTNLYTYHGPVPPVKELRARILLGERDLLEELEVSWVLYYTRTTTGRYRIIDSEVLPVPARPPSTGRGPDGVLGPRAEGRSRAACDELSRVGQVPPGHKLEWDGKSPGEEG